MSLHPFYHRRAGAVKVFLSPIDRRPWWAANFAEIVMLTVHTPLIMQTNFIRNAEKTDVKRVKISHTVPISERPAGAENRTRFGHMEKNLQLIRNLQKQRTWRRIFVSLIRRGTNENTNGLLRQFYRKALPLPTFPMMICSSLSIWLTIVRGNAWITLLP